MFQPFGWKKVCEKGSVCVCVFITAVPITKLFAWGEGKEEFDGPSVSSLAGLERQRSQSVA